MEIICCVVGKISLIVVYVTVLEFFAECMYSKALFLKLNNLVFAR